jgi:acetyl-CoA carboxylase carboxyl transferase subunit beta
VSSNTGQTVWALVDSVTGGARFDQWDEDVTSDDPLGFSDTLPYADRLVRARESSGLNESVVTGRTRVGRHDVALVAGAFEFLAGTLGVASAERVVRAFERAADLQLPIVGLPISGGTRMQEGTLGFVQMATCSAAVRRFRDSGLPYIAWLRHPTTGGVLASWASLATVTFAEPGALVGMIGPRVIEAITGEAFPEGVQTAENLRAHGLVDDVVTLDDLPDRIDRVLAVTSVAPEPWQVDAAPLALDPDKDVDGWTAVQRSRRVDRPGIR